MNSDKLQPGEMTTAELIDYVQTAQIAVQQLCENLTTALCAVERRAKEIQSAENKRLPFDRTKEYPFVITNS